MMPSQTVIEMRSLTDIKRSIGTFENIDIPKRTLSAIARRRSHEYAVYVMTRKLAFATRASASGGGE